MAGITTVRQATLKRTGNPTCAGCHTTINELGFAFEYYDAIGRTNDLYVILSALGGTDTTFGDSKYAYRGTATSEFLA